VRNLVPAQSRRAKAIEDRIESLQEALMTQVAGIESHYRTAISTAELKLTAQINVLKSRVDAAETGRLEAEHRAADAQSEADHVRGSLDTYRQVWQSAPLTHRLKFLRELLPEEHRLQPVLNEASALEDLRKRGRDLETWLVNYPSLFADAMQSLETGTQSITAGAHPAGSKPEAVDILALQTLEEAKTTLSGALQALGITWIAPSPGDLVLSEHEVIADERSPQPEGRVAGVRRRGFRVQGRVAMPAQVTRAVAAAESGAYNVQQGVQIATGERTGEAAGAQIAPGERAGEAAAPGERGEAGSRAGDQAGADTEPRTATGEAGAAGSRPAGGASATNRVNQLYPTDLTDRSDPTDESASTAPANAANSAAPPREANSEAPPSGGQTEKAKAAAEPAAQTIQRERAAGTPQLYEGTAAAAEAQSPHAQPTASQIPPSQQETTAASPTAAQAVTPLTITGEMPDWLRMLVQRTHGCESQPVLRYVYQIVKLVNLPGELSKCGSAESAAAALTDALSPLVRLLGLRYADGLPEIDAQWGAVLLEARDPLISWLRENPQVSVVAPVRGQKFDPQTMEAIETRRTVHESENETVSRVESIGLTWRDRPLIRARVVRYAIEEAT
jgi:molecular chaperone GrpE (heat shock protein)